MRGRFVPDGSRCVQRTCGIRAVAFASADRGRQPRHRARDDVVARADEVCPHPPVVALEADADDRVDDSPHQDNPLHPDHHNSRDLDVDHDDVDLARGGEIFRVNCAMCHAASAGGGALTRGKFAPTLHGVEEKHIYEAMQTGPQNMPVFSDANISPDQKRDVIAYLKEFENQGHPGGFSLGSLGPVAEGLFIWTAGLGLVIGFMVWLTSRSS